MVGWLVVDPPTSGAKLLQLLPKKGQCRGASVVFLPTSTVYQKWMTISIVQTRPATERGNINTTYVSAVELHIWSK
jgi:hypothetical protein